MPVELIWVWAAVAVPSWPVVDRLLGSTALVVHSVSIAAALLLAPRVFAAIPAARVTVLRLVTALVVVVLFAVAFPRFNVHEPGAGSDDDDAHDAGVAALIAFESPYSRQTYLGHALHQLPGSFVLAAPFTLLGTSALQNLACLALFFLMLSRDTRDRRTPLLMAWLGVLLSAAVLYQTAIGSSYSWNAIWVLAGVWWIIRRPASWPAAVFLGIAICSRLNFVLLLPPLFGWLWRAHGRSTAVRALLPAVLVAAALAIPFYLTSEYFGPLEAMHRLEYEGAMPGSGSVLVVSMGLLACGLAFVRTDRAGLFLQCALVQGFPVAAGLILSMMNTEDHNRLSMALYGSFAAWFALMGAAIRIETWLARRDPAPVS